MFSLHPYIREDLPTINVWLAARKAKKVEHSDMPEVGYVAYKNGDPIAAAFLRRCEGNIAILDSLCTDPMARGELRHEAIDLLVNKIIEQCAHMRIKSLFAFTVDAGILDRSQKHGFVKSDHIVISREVS